MVRMDLNLFKSCVRTVSNNQFYDILLFKQFSQTSSHVHKFRYTLKCMFQWIFILLIFWIWVLSIIHVIDICTIFNTIFVCINKCDVDHLNVVLHSYNLECRISFSRINSKCHIVFLLKLTIAFLYRINLDTKGRSAIL